MLIIPVAAVGAVGGLSLLLWFLVHAYVAARCGARLGRQDYVVLGAAAVLLGASLVTIVIVGGRAGA